LQGHHIKSKKIYEISHLRSLIGISKTPNIPIQDNHEAMRTMSIAHHFNEEAGSSQEIGDERW